MVNRLFAVAVFGPLVAVSLCLFIHFHQHFQFQQCIGSKTRLRAKSQTSPKTTNPTETIRNAARESIIDLQQKKMRCCIQHIENENFDLSPLLYLFYILFVIIFIISVMAYNILQFTSYQIHLELILRYYSILIAIYDSYFCFFRYYTAKYAAQYCHIASATKVFKLFSIFATLFVLLFVAQIHFFHELFPVIIGVYFCFNIYCSTKFWLILVKQTRRFTEGQLFLVAVYDEMISNVYFMRVSSYLSCLFSTLFVATIATHMQYEYTKYISFVFLSISCICSTLIFIRNRLFIRAGISKIRHFKCKNKPLSHTPENNGQINQRNSGNAGNKPVRRDSINQSGHRDVDDAIFELPDDIHSSYSMPKNELVIVSPGPVSPVSCDSQMRQTPTGIDINLPCAILTENELIDSEDSNSVTFTQRQEQQTSANTFAKVLKLLGVNTSNNSDKTKVKDDTMPPPIKTVFDRVATFSSMRMGLHKGHKSCSDAYGPSFSDDKSETINDTTKTIKSAGNSPIGVNNSHSLIDILENDIMKDFGSSNDSHVAVMDMNTNDMELNLTDWTTITSRTRSQSDATDKSPTTLSLQNINSMGNDKKRRPSAPTTMRESISVSMHMGKRGHGLGNDIVLQLMIGNGLYTNTNLNMCLALKRVQSEREKKSNNFKD